MSFFERITGQKDKNETKHELSEEERVNVNINVGHSGAKSASRDLSRKHDYEKIRADVNQDTITMLIRILDKVDTKTQFYTQVEDEGIPLLTLVALGITSEEAIKSYRVLRARGIDTYKAQTSKTQTVDDEYANEIYSNTKDIPRLMTMDGHGLDEPLTSEELYKGEVKTRTRIESELRTAKNKLARLEERPEPEPEVKYEERVEQEIVDIGDMFDDTETEDVDSEDHLTGEEYKSWNNEFKKMKESLVDKKEKEDYVEEVSHLGEVDGLTEEDLEDLADEEVEELTEGKYQAVRSAHQLKEFEKRDKEIFILSEPFEIEEDLDGYRIIFIEEPEDLVLFTASKDNLLVITRAIPLQLVEMFIDWIGSVSSKGISLRAVTLKGMEIEHSFIEGTIELTQESIDHYYEQNKLSKYIGSGVATFFDIGETLNDY